MDCYIRNLTHDQAKAVAPELQDIDADVELWALFDQDGYLILLTDNRSSTFFKAYQDEMTVRTVH